MAFNADSSECSTEEDGKTEQNQAPDAALRTIFPYKCRVIRHRTGEIFDVILTNTCISLRSDNNSVCYDLENLSIDKIEIVKQAGIKLNGKGHIRVDEKDFHRGLIITQHQPFEAFIFTSNYSVINQLYAEVQARSWARFSCVIYNDNGRNSQALLVGQDEVSAYQGDTQVPLKAGSDGEYARSPGGRITDTAPPELSDVSRKDQPAALVKKTKSIHTACRLLDDTATMPKSSPCCIVVNQMRIKTENRNGSRGWKSWLGRRPKSSIMTNAVPLS